MEIKCLVQGHNVMIWLAFEPANRRLQVHCLKHLTTTLSHMKIQQEYCETDYSGR